MGELMLTSSSGDVGPRKGDTGHSEPGERPGRQLAHRFVVVSEGAGSESGTSKCLGTQCPNCPPTRAPAIGLHTPKEYVSKLHSVIH